MTLSAFLMGVFMTSLAVTVHYKEKFYHENCLRLSPNSSLPDRCQTNTTSLQQEDGLETIKLVLDIWPAVSVILYMLGKFSVVKSVWRTCQELIMVWMHSNVVSNNKNSATLL